jgi:Spy/CpxP family protein refolding chaperone
MKKLTLVLSFLFTAALCTLFHTNAYSQTSSSGTATQNATPRDPGKFIERMIERIDKAVTLTPDQKKKIQAIYEKNMKDHEQSAGDSTTSRRDRLNQSRERGRRGEAVNQEIEKVLTTEQVKKFREMRRQSSGFSVDTRIEQLNTSLNLTDEQKKNIRPILEKEGEKFQNMRSQMQEGQDRSARMESFRKIREETDAEIIKILTPEQVKKYKEMQEQMRSRMQNRRQQ